MTYQNVESADIAFIRDTVSRWTDPISAVFSDDLMPRGVTVRWDWTSRLRGDTQTTANVLSVLVQNQILTVDEARAWLGRPPTATVNDEGTTPEGVPELTGSEVA